MLGDRAERQTPGQPRHEVDHQVELGDPHSSSYPALHWKLHGFSRMGWPLTTPASLFCFSCSLSGVTGQATPRAHYAGRGEPRDPPKPSPGKRKLELSKLPSNL